MRARKILTTAEQRHRAQIYGIRFVRFGKSWAMGGGAVSMVAALARLREAAARIARLFGIRAMRNALRAHEGGRHYDCAARICRKRARPLAMR